MEPSIPSQKEALLNELKGNLFEYLVGQNLALQKGILSEFYRNFGGELKNKLVQYENWLRNNDPILFKKLPNLASSLAKELTLYLPEKIDNLLVVGKAGGGGHRFKLNEADLLAISKKEMIPISVKLCKAKAFVNTKSGGVKSFIVKYFSNFPNAPIWQEELNEVLNIAFQHMGHELYAQAGLEFTGQFDERWEHSHLPGKVPVEMRPVIYKFYSQVILKIYDIFKIMYGQSQEDFKKCLYPIMGFGNLQIIQATCFHGILKGKKYNLKGVKVFTGDELKQNLKKLKLEKLKADLSSFEMRSDELILQIRVKPMNIFTTPAVKINCSIKEAL
ncbi:MAG: hypothetical protein DRQ88_04180 [Epsilonproteobacteria bacterium]|nr:MAG: hypothetical protein DRQ89_00545 [Campylobacterota bacterium]RLA67098.1 MAG: hypothetical protein DRQ88_04180 [Campylobacterota bacterium]